MKFFAVLLMTAAFTLVSASASAQCSRGGGSNTGDSGSSSGRFSVIGGSIRGSSVMDAQAQIDRRNAMYAAQIYQTAARQGAAARLRFQRHVAVKNAYRERVQQVAAALGREPRLTKHEQLRLKVIARKQQRTIDRMTRGGSSIRDIPNVQLPVRNDRNNSSAASQPQTVATNTNKTWTRRYSP